MDNANYELKNIGLHLVKTNKENICRNAVQSAIKGKEY